MIKVNNSFYKYYLNQTKFNVKKIFLYIDEILNICI